MIIGMQVYKTASNVTDKSNKTDVHTADCSNEAQFLGPINLFK